MTYIAAEPEQITMFKDVKGDLHTDREKAIFANFVHDLSEEVNATFNSIPYADTSPVKLTEFLCRFVENNPSMIRVLLKDRDAT